MGKEKVKEENASLLQLPIAFHRAAANVGKASLCHKEKESLKVGR
jgi:hypothetical protein